MVGLGVGDGETPCQPHCEEHDLKGPDSPGPGLMLIEWHGNGSKGVLQKHCGVPRGCFNGHGPSGGLQA